MPDFYNLLVVLLAPVLVQVVPVPVLFFLLTHVALATLAVVFCTPLYDKILVSLPSNLDNPGFVHMQHGTAPILLQVFDPTAARLLVSFNVVEHCHEDDPSCELFRITPNFVHHSLNFFEDLQCGESWENLPRLPSVLHQFDPIFCIVESY